MSWRDHIKVHPAADLLPMMTGEAMQTFVENLKRESLIEPIGVIDRDGWVLVDGRNRLEAMERLGKSFDDLMNRGDVEDLQLADDEVVDYIIAINIHRRHLTAKQKRDLTAKLLKADPGKSDNAIAKITKVSDKTVAKVRRELETRSEIPNVEIRTDTKGRKQRGKRRPRPQQAKKAKTTSVPKPVMSPDQAPIAPDTPAETAPVMMPAEMVPTVPEQSAAPALVPDRTADEIDGLTSDQQNQVLHLMLRLLVSVDTKHQKQFRKHLVRNSRHGVYLSPRGHRRWMDQGYAVDPAVVGWVVNCLPANLPPI
jgi:ParB-like chromosome segregation protein Spo0J